MDSTLSPHFSSATLKPCLTCRRRKVRCDKAKPKCSNCTRLGAECTYDVEQSQADSDLRERLERLEQLMQSMGGISLDAKAQPKPGDSIKGFTSISRQPNSPGLWISNLQPHEQLEEGYGVQVFEPGISVHLAPGYWMTMFEQTDELRFLLKDREDPEGNLQNQGSSLFVGSGYHSPSPSLDEFHPPLDQSDLLCKLFVEGVEPFIRLTHRQTFLRELQLFRSGQLKVPPYANEFEAMLLAIYALTITTLRSDTVERLFGEARATLLTRYRLGAEKALIKFDVYRSRKPMIFKALLYYITFLYELGRYDDATPLVGLAVRKAQQIGMLRDSSYFNHAPWVGEMRRRMFTYLHHVDSIALDAEGVESALPSASWDMKFPTNADDLKWDPTRFSSRKSAPLDAEGFSDMTFVIVRRELSMLLQIVLSRLSSAPIEHLCDILQQAMEHIDTRYLQHLDERQPMQRLVARYASIFGARIRLLLDHARIGRLQECTIEGEERLFEDAVQLLEQTDGFQNEVAPMNWDWLFRGTVHWHTTAVVLFNLQSHFEGPIVERAWNQVELIFSRHNNAEIRLNHTPMWQFLDQSRERALFNRRAGKVSHIPCWSIGNPDWHSVIGVSDVGFDTSMAYLGADVSMPPGSQGFVDYFPCNTTQDTPQFGF